MWIKKIKHMKCGIRIIFKGCSRVAEAGGRTLAVRGRGGAPASVSVGWARGWGVNALMRQAP